MTSVVDPEYHWFDFKVLDFLKQYGCRRFWGEDIWSFDWYDFLEYACVKYPERYEGVSIFPPPSWSIPVLDVASSQYDRVKGGIMSKLNR